MYKIYFDYKPIIIVNNTADVEDYLNNPAVIYLDDLSANSVDTMMKELRKQEFDTGVFCHSDTEAVLNEFKKHLELITAAGGLVYTSKKEILMIHRRGKWDLPKGKLDDDEDIKTCAEREVKEETGLNSVELLDKLHVSYHAYHEKNKDILKETHWYLMKANHQELTPQVEEDITACEWIAADQIEEHLDHSYTIIREVVTEAKKKLKWI